MSQFPSRRGIAIDGSPLRLICRHIIIGFNIDPIVRDIQEAIERERIAEQAVGWNMILFPTPAIRRMLFVGVGTAIAQQAVGIDPIQYYLMDVLEESGIENEKSRLAVMMLLGVIKLLFILVGGYVVYEG